MPSAQPPGAPGPTGDMAPPPSGDAAAGTTATLPSIALAEGEGIKLSGTFNYAGSATGNMRLDFFRVGADGRPEILHAMALEKTGEWAVNLPAKLGKINILAFI